MNIVVRKPAFCLAYIYAGNLVFRWEYLRTFCCSPKSIFDRLVTHFLHVIFVYMYLLLLHFMFSGENKELKTCGNRAADLRLYFRYIAQSLDFEVPKSGIISL